MADLADGDKGRGTGGNLLNTDSMKQLMTKNYASTTDLEIKENHLKRKAADMLMQNIGEEVEEYKYEEMAED